MGRGNESLRGLAHAACLAGFALVAFTPGASGQAVVDGQVLDARSGGPVIAARVLLVRPDDTVVRSTDTDAQGAFTLPIAWVGTYRLRVERIGYPDHTTDPITVEQRDRLEIEIRLNPEAIGLDSLVVVGRRRESGREAFERRRSASERGTFLDPIHVALLEPVLPSDVLRRLPDIEVSPNTIRHELSSRCLVVFLDDMRLPLMASGRNAPQKYRQALGGEVRLDDFERARNVRAVEVYPTIADVPWEMRRSRRWPEIGQCGVIQIWTTMAW